MSQRPQIRLLHLPSNTLSLHHSESCPAYIAVSHTWESKLFPPPPCYSDPPPTYPPQPTPSPPSPSPSHQNSLTLLPQFSSVPGYPLLQSAMHSHSFDTIEYVWVDTWCIIQNDPNDKRGQIANMDNIYRDAMAVVVMLDRELGWEQKDVDEIAKAPSVGFLIQAWEEEWPILDNLLFGDLTELEEVEGEEGEGEEGEGEEGEGEEVEGDDGGNVPISIGDGDRIEIPEEKPVQPEAVTTRNSRLDDAKEDDGNTLAATRSSYEEEQVETIQSSELFNMLCKCMDILSTLATAAWSSRIWTLQEFVLARRAVFIGADRRALEIPDPFFVAMPEIWDLYKIDGGKRFEELSTRIRGMGAARMHKIDQTRIMELAAYRQCSVAEDEIYGVMAAMGVMVPTSYGEGIDAAWRRWWEKAVMEGNIRWCMLPSQKTEDSKRWSNCVMPPVELRAAASTASSLDTVKPLGTVSVNDGTVELTGWEVGEIAPTDLLRLGPGVAVGDGSNALHNELTLFRFAGGSRDLAVRLAGAFGGWLLDSKQRGMIADIIVSNYQAAREYDGDMFDWVTDFHGVGGDVLYLAALLEHVWKRFLELQLVVMAPLVKCDAWLARLNGADVVFCVNEEVVISEDEPLHVVNFAANEEKDGRSTLMVLRKTDGSWHKVGMTVPTKLANDSIEAKEYGVVYVPNGAVETTTIWRVGGRECGLCARKNSTGFQLEEITTSNK